MAVQVLFSKLAEKMAQDKHKARKSDLKRTYISLDGTSYLVPMSAIRREHGFTLTHQQECGKIRIYQFNESDFYNIDHCFQAVVSVVDYLLANDLLLLNLQAPKDHIRITDEVISTYVYSSCSKQFILRRKRVKRIREKGLLDYHINLMIKERLLSIKEYRIDLRNELPNFISKPLYRQGTSFNVKEFVKEWINGCAK